MAKITIQTILAGFRSVAGLNSDFQKITTDLNNKVLYRDNPEGEDNTMQNDLDMNSNRIINLPFAVSDGEPVTLGQLDLDNPADVSAAQAAVSAAQSEAALVTFEQNYLGQFAVAPTLDNEGNALLEGALYYDTVANAMLLWNGSAWVAFAIVENGWKPIIPFYYASIPADGALMMQFVSPQTIVLPENLTESYARSVTAATAVTALTIKKNGGSIGTVNFAIAATTGTFTFASDVTLAAGDILTIHNQGTADLTLADISITLRTDQIVGAVLAKYSADYFTGSGTSTAYVLTAVGLTVAPTAYEDGMSIAWKPSVTNAGALTVNVAGLGVVALVDTLGSAFTGGELIIDTHTEARYDLANNRFYTTTPVANPADQQWPVDSIYTSASSANPAGTIGYGTWTAYGQGRVLIGIGSGDDGVDIVAFAAAEEGGEYNHIQTAGELATHTHTGVMREDGNTPGNGAPEEGDNSTSGIFTTNSAGSSDPMNNIQPYIAVYYWRRTV